MTSDVSMVNSSSSTTSRAASAMESMDADADDAVATALMLACEEEDADQVRKLLSVDKKVRINSTHTAVTSLITL